MKNKLIIILGLIYIVLAIFITKFLLDRNSFGVYVKGNNYYVYNSEITEYSKTSLVRFEKREDYEDLIGEDIYYFDNDKVLKKDKLVSFSKADQVFSVESSKYSIENMLGKPNKGYFLVGLILGFFTTKLVYLCIVIIPVFILLIYEIYLLFNYMKKDNKRKVSQDEENESSKE